MTPSVRTLKGSKTKGFQGATPLCPRGSNARGFSNKDELEQEIEDNFVLWRENEERMEEYYEKNI